MLPGWVSNPGPLTYESGALPNALRGPAYIYCLERHLMEILVLKERRCHKKICIDRRGLYRKTLFWPKTGVIESCALTQRICNRKLSIDQSGL